MFVYARVYMWVCACVCVMLCRAHNIFALRYCLYLLVTPEQLLFILIYSTRPCCPSRTRADHVASSAISKDIRWWCYVPIQSYTRASEYIFYRIFMHFLFCKYSCEHPCRVNTRILSGVEVAEWNRTEVFFSNRLPWHWKSWRLSQYFFYTIFTFSFFFWRKRYWGNSHIK